MTFSPLRLLFFLVIVAAAVLFGFAIWAPDWQVHTGNRIAVTGIDVLVGGIASLLCWVK